jgi:hypothetical protein
MDTGHIVFLVVGIVVVLVVGQLLIRSGGRYLANSAPAEGDSAGSAATLVAILFHLFALGIVILITVIPMGSTSQQAFLLRTGLLLVVLAVLYGVTLMMLSRRRQEAIITEMEMPRQQEPGSLPPPVVRTPPTGTPAAAQPAAQAQSVNPIPGQTNPVPGIIDNTPPDTGARY